MWRRRSRSFGRGMRRRASDVSLIPLKLTQGYEADGWLGLLLGTLLWYAGE